VKKLKFFLDRKWRIKKNYFGIDTSFQPTRWSSVVKKFWPGCARSILIISFITVA